MRIRSKSLEEEDAEIGFGGSSLESSSGDSLMVDWVERKDVEEVLSRGDRGFSGKFRGSLS